MLALALFSRDARAERARVVLLQPSAPDEVVAEVATRVRAELTAAMFEVVVVTVAPGADPREQAESAAIEPRPIATLAIVRLNNRPAVDVWVSDRVTEKTSVKRLDLGKRADPEITSALAIHAVELLRASLLETRARSRTAQLAPNAAARRPVAKEVADWVDSAVQPPAKTLLEGRTVAIAGAVVHSFAGIGPAVAPAVRVSLGAPSGIAARLSLIGPAFGANLQRPKGTAFVRQELALVELVYAPSRGWLMPMASVGVGGYHLYTSGQKSNPADIDQTDNVWAGLVDAGLGLAARLGTNAALTLEAHAFVTQPGARVSIGTSPEDSVGPAGRPSFVASLGLQSSF